MPELLPPVPHHRPHIPPAETPGSQALLTIVVGVVVVAGLYVGRDVLIPIGLAVLLSFVLAPLANLLRRLHLGRVGSVLLSVLFAIGIIVALAGLVGTQVADLAADAPRYEANVQRKIDTLRAMTLDRISAMLRDIEAETPRLTALAPEPKAKTAAPAQSAPTAQPRPVPVQVVQPPPQPLALATSVLVPALHPVATIGIIFVVAVFILLQRDDLRDRLIRLLGSTDLHRTTMAIDDAAHRLSRFYLAQLCINATFGVVIGTGLFFIGIPGAALFGALAAFLRFVPYVGTPLAAILPLALGAAIGAGWTMAIAVAVLFVAVELIVSQAAEPLVYGRSTGLSPFAVIVAAIFWAWLWGPIGLILSTPLSLCLVVLGRHFERLAFLDVMLGDRPALTPVENFYQRALAGHAEEAEEQAEQMLKERSLSSYYDEVALRGLQLAANDLRRHVLTPEQLARIHEMVTELVEALEDYDDADPAPGGLASEVLAPPAAELALPVAPAPAGAAPAPAERAARWRGQTPVLCVPARGALDEAVCQMLAQLLEKHGVGARAVPHAEVLRHAMHRLDTAGVALICVSCLDHSGTLAPVRHMVRRLAQQAPGAQMLVGLWTPDGAPPDAERQRATGAGLCVTSLRAAVQACLEAARTGEAVDAVAVERSVA